MGGRERRRSERDFTGVGLGYMSRHVRPVTHVACRNRPANPGLSPLRRASRSPSTNPMASTLRGPVHTPMLHAALSTYADRRSSFYVALPFRQLARRGFATATALPSIPTVAPTPTHALSLIASQPSQYVVASIAGRKYLLSPRDLLTVPRLNDVRVGDVLALSEIHELGSREYTLRGAPVIPPGTVKVQATVVEHTKGAMETIVKFKKRKGYRKTVKHKQTYTRLRIGPIELGLGEQPSS